MRLRGLRFPCHFCASQALGPALVYLFEAPNVINPSGDGDLAFQQIFHVWIILGIIIISALVTTLTLIILVATLTLIIMGRKQHESMSLSNTDDPEIAQSLFLQNVASFHSSRYEVNLAEFRKSIEENQRRHDVTAA
jgi:hypothetical protein